MACKLYYIILAMQQLHVRFMDQRHTDILISYITDLAMGIMNTYPQELRCIKAINPKLLHHIHISLYICLVSESIQWQQSNQDLDGELPRWGTIGRLYRKTSTCALPQVGARKWQSCSAFPPCSSTWWVNQEREFLQAEQATRTAGDISPSFNWTNVCMRFNRSRPGIKAGLKLRPGQKWKERNRGPGLYPNKYSIHAVTT